MTSGSMAIVTRDDILAAREQAWELNNIALKTIRDTNEGPPGWVLPTRGDGVDLFGHEEYPVLSLERPHDTDPEHSPMDYKLVLPYQQWNWKAMIKSRR